MLRSHTKLGQQTLKILKSLTSPANAQLIHVARPLSAEIIIKSDTTIGVDSDAYSSAGEGKLEQRNLLTRQDGLGFSLSQITLKKGYEHEVHLKNHVAALYVVEGEGDLSLASGDESTGKRAIAKATKGSVIALPTQDRLFLSTSSTLKALWIHNPPLTGKESINDADQVLPAVDEDGNVYPEYDVSMVPRLFTPPPSLKGGTCPMKDDPLF